MSNAEEFGNWFGVNLKGKSFAPGQRARGQITYPGYEYLVFEVWIERMEPERLLSWRWHPAPVERASTTRGADPLVIRAERSGGRHAAVRRRIRLRQHTAAPAPGAFR